MCGTISGRIFNQKKVVQELDFNVGTEDMHCDCSTCRYCYEPAGHVVTGDLNIIRDAKLRELIRKGPSYREQNSIDWRVNEDILTKAVSEYKCKWASKEKIDVRVLNEWEQTVVECIRRRIGLLRAKHINRRKQHVLRSRKHLQHLHELQSKYVLVPADKAANNVIVVCKKYYLEVVMKEITETSTYEHINKESMNVVNEHLSFMNSHRIKVVPELRCLPLFYWLPKLHKQPYGTRFIAASNKCSTKPLSKLLTTCLQMISCHFKQYCSGIYSRTGVNCFWIIDNSQQVLSALHNINYFSTAKHFDSYDFSTLYTSIPHTDLKTALISLIKEAYRVRDNIYLIVDNRGRAFWSDVPSKASYKSSVTEEMLIILVEYLIDNIYVSIGNRVFRQCVGIPMGTDCAPLFANLFLFYYEYKYMKNLIKTNLMLAKKFNGTMRYIDDLLTLNNKCFESTSDNIYPPELHLKKTTECPTKLSYLDILIDIDNGKYSTAVYDKRDGFSFEIVNFPFLCSNIPSKPAYGVYISQLVRIGRICSTFERFKDRHYKLTEKLIKQGFWYTGLCMAFKRFVRSHANIFHKYKCSVKKHIEEGICLPANDVFLSHYICRR